LRTREPPSSTEGEPSDLPEHTGGTWSVLRYSGFTRLFISTAVVVFGVVGQGVARGWLARDLTGTNTGLGGVMLAFGVAMLVSTPLGGVAADRFPKRAVLIGAVVVLGVSSLWIGIAVETGTVTYWMLLIASALQAGAFAFYIPARIAFLSDLVDAGSIEDAVVLSQISGEAMRVIAPALAGALVGAAWFGVGGVFLLAGALAGISVVILLGVPRGTPHGRVHGSPFDDLVDAIRYVRASHALTLLALTTIGVVMIGYPYMTFLPSVATTMLDVGAGGYGLMSAIAGLGAVLGGVFVIYRPPRRDPWRAIFLSGLTFGVALIALGLSPSFGVVLAVLLVVGATGLIVQTTSQSLVLTLSDFEYHGRLQGMVVLGFSGFGLAALPLGIVADAVGLRSTLAGMGVVVLLIMAGFGIAHARRPSVSPPVDLG